MITSLKQKNLNWKGFASAKGVGPSFGSDLANAMSAGEIGERREVGPRQVVAMNDEAFQENAILRPKN